MKTRGICLYTRNDWLDIDTFNVLYIKLCVGVWGLALADDGLPVVTANVVEPDAVVVEVVQDSNTELVSFSVVRLSPSSARKGTQEMREESVSCPDLPASV